MPDLPQSVLDRLKAKARSTGKSVQLVLQLFCQEEFLRRLQLSKYSDRFILKGGLLLYSLSGFTGRPTMDVDFLAKRINSELSALGQSYEKSRKLELATTTLVLTSLEQNPLPSLRSTLVCGSN
jgi:hypothetical protein